MTDWEQLITESQSLDERASKIQDGERVGLSKEEINKFTYDYYSWFAKCLSPLPEDLKNRFRERYEGSFWNAKIKKFLEALTEPSLLYQWAEEKAKAMFPPWSYPSNKNFSRYLLSQSRSLMQ